MRLIDGIERNAKNPITFTIPTPEEKAGLIAGDFAKVGIMGDRDRIDRQQPRLHRRARHGPRRRDQLRVAPHS